MDTSAISGTTTASTYVASTSSATDTGTDFASVLASQTTSSDSSADTTSASAAEQALSAYSSGQVTAYALTSEGTDGTNTDTALEETAASTEAASASSTTSGSSESGDTSSTEETTASAEGAGFPAEVNAEWTPSHMQFYDEATGKWMDDNIPHRVTDNGDLQYYADGEWHADTAVKHRMVDDNGNPIALVDENGDPITSEETASSETTASDTEGGESADSSADLVGQAEVYFNAALQNWKLYNLPDAVDKDGKRVYFWGDSWHADNWQHQNASGSGVEIASNPAGAAGLSSTSVASTSTDTSTTSSTDNSGTTSTA